jgi:hypothetical protein
LIRKLSIEQGLNTKTQVYPEGKSEKSEVKLSREFWVELAQLIFLNHAIYSIFYAILLRIFEYQKSGLVGIGLLSILYIIPIPIMVRIFNNLEKKAVLKGEGVETKKKKGVYPILTWRGNLREYLEAFFISVGVYLPFGMLLIVIGLVLG